MTTETIDAKRARVNFGIAAEDLIDTAEYLLQVASERDGHLDAAYIAMLRDSARLARATLKNLKEAVR